MLTPDSASRLVALYEVMADAARDNDWGRRSRMLRLRLPDAAVSAA